jgi:TPR repeat protein
MKKYLFSLYMGLILVTLVLVCFADDLDEGVGAYERGDYPEALRILKPLTKKGVAESYYYLGLMYLYGDGVQEDVSDAINMFRNGANQKDPKAENALGMMYEIGEGIDQDYAQAVKWYR